MVLLGELRQKVGTFSGRSMDLTFGLRGAQNSDAMAYFARYTFDYPNAGSTVPANWAAYIR